MRSVFDFGASGACARRLLRAQIGSTFLQLKVVIDRGDAREDVLMELALPQVRDMHRVFDHICVSECRAVLCIRGCGLMHI